MHTPAPAPHTATAAAAVRSSGRTKTAADRLSPGHPARVPPPAPPTDCEPEPAPAPAQASLTRQLAQLREAIAATREEHNLFNSARPGWASSAAAAARPDTAQ